MSISKVVHLNGESVHRAVESSKILVIDFWAEWCGPCKMMSDIVDKLSTEVSDDIIVAKLNVDECAKSCTDFNIKSIPTFIFFKNGKEVQRINGLISLDSLLDVIKEINV